MPLKRTTYSPWVRHYPMHIVPGGTKRMEGHVKEDKELDELCKKITQLDQDMIDNDNALEEHINEVDSKYQKITDALDTRLGHMEDLGIIFAGSNNKSKELGTGNDRNFELEVTSTGNKPDPSVAGSSALCIVDQRSTASFIPPAGAKEFFVTIGHGWPFKALNPGDVGYTPGFEYQVSNNKTFTTGGIQVLHSISEVDVIRKLSYGATTGHGLQGYLFYVLKICLSEPITSPFTVSASIKGWSYLKGFDNLGQFPIMGNGLDGHFLDMVQNFDDLCSKCKISTSMITSV